MPLRTNIELEMRPLLKALRTRIAALKHTKTVKDKLEIFLRDDLPFLQLEIRRDHMLLDLWLPEKKLEEARSSGIARAHPFMGQEAIKVRFERAEDLTRVARWLEESYRFAPIRDELPPSNGATEKSARAARKPGAGKADKKKAEPKNNNSTKKASAKKTATKKKTAAKKKVAKKKNSAAKKKNSVAKKSGTKRAATQAAKKTAKKKKPVKKSARKRS